MPAYGVSEISARLDRFSRIGLIHVPTPFRKLGRIFDAFGDGPTLWIKRDDLTGLAFGGNKSRKLEYIMGDMAAKKADTVVTWGSLQSNWCMQTAAAARMIGAKPVLVLFKTNPGAPADDGNLLLDRILDADVLFREAPPGIIIKSAQALAVLEEVGAELRAEGLKPYLVPVGGSLVRGDMDKPFGALSYIQAFTEIAVQAAAAGFIPDYVVHATGSGGTQAGLVVGAKAMTDACRVVGISVSDPKGPFSRDVLEIAGAAVRTLDLDISIGPEDVDVRDEFIKEGYGIVNREVAEVIRFVFQSEGIVLDPVYTGKAMAGLLALIARGDFRKGQNIVFVHTGGTPALFPNREGLVGLLREPSS